MLFSERCTINDVAQKAGVSAMAVSLALKKSPRVSPATRERILAAAKELNYVPNQTARQLRSGKSDIIGFIAADLANPFHSMMVKQAEIAARQSGLSVFVCSSNWSPVRELESAERLIRMQSRGVLVCPVSNDNTVFEMFQTAGIPSVALDAVADTFQGCSVLNDLQRSGALMAEHFAEIGVSIPIYIDAANDKNNFCAFAKIRDGFCKRWLALRGTECRIISGGMNIPAGSSACRELVKKQVKFDGVFCVNDLCALGFMDESAKQGFTAGKDYALGGIDDIETASLSQISLTSIRLPYQEIAANAVEILGSILEQRSGNVTGKVLPPVLLRRNTTLQFAKIKGLL